MDILVDIPHKGNWLVKQYLLLDAEREEITIFQPDLKNPTIISMLNVSSITIKLKED